MTTLLQLDSSPLGANSASRALTAAIAQTLKTTGQVDNVVYRDLSVDPISHLDGALLSAMRPAEGATTPESVKGELALNDTLIDELFAADVIVIGAPMYNFSIPTQLKAWIDRVAQAGRTFRYTATGPEGLVTGKRAIIASSRGGVYAGSQMETALDHQEAYLKGVLGFIGITDVKVIRAEGLGMGPEARQKAMDAAIAQSQELTA
ncbi:FMN-dependent NADH-azoreductase [Pigmentiphaga aceris]|uniref:FMN dependent NADH:quinone oxidoreductase n=1 Tax=Pigmentiphaga aceris TaxID=1940612 RepID=A0A5C0AUV5_9BURK|nr:FMN-dependent NADH-azoreductase [Pigmentiphaga aceris]QEI04690.1 FMN-dependent NADH-azoreductase [Pigmentiphaga aceris]